MEKPLWGFFFDESGLLYLVHTEDAVADPQLLGASVPDSLQQVFSSVSIFDKERISGNELETIHSFPSFGQPCKAC